MMDYEEDIDLVYPLVVGEMDDCDVAGSLNGGGCCDD